MSLPATKIAEQLLVRPHGATMDEIIAATGGPQYNVLKKLERSTRYFASPPGEPCFEATVTSQGQVTIPKEVREHLKLRSGQKVRFVLKGDGRVEIAPKSHSITDLFGILGKPPRSATIEEMDEAIGRGAVERYLRSTR